MPAVGFGTFLIKSGKDSELAVASALKLGYRHIDTAQLYKNEKDVGIAVKESGISRAELFITTKVSPKNMSSKEQVWRSIMASYQELNSGPIDLLLIHWPRSTDVMPSSVENETKRREAWETMEQAVGKGMAKCLGVANFEPAHIESLMKYAKIKPVINQIEFHPMYKRWDIIDTCKKHGILVTAYSSLGGKKGKMTLVQHPIIQKIAKEIGKDWAQVLLRWGVQHGHPVIPKSVNPEYQATNRQVLDWKLSADQMAELDSITAMQKFCWDPAKIR